jgi:hypothetical protein
MTKLTRPLDADVATLLERCWVAMFAVQNALDAGMTLTADHPDITDLTPVMEAVRAAISADEALTAQAN